MHQHDNAQGHLCALSIANSTFFFFSFLFSTFTNRSIVNLLILFFECCFFFVFLLHHYIPSDNSSPCYTLSYYNFTSLLPYYHLVIHIQIRLYFRVQFTPKPSAIGWYFFCKMVWNKYYLQDNLTSRIYIMKWNIWHHKFWNVFKWPDILRTEQEHCFPFRSGVICTICHLIYVCDITVVCKEISVIAPWYTMSRRVYSSMLGYLK